MDAPRTPPIGLPALPSTPLARHALDRDYKSRSREDLIQVLLADPTTRVLLLKKSTALIADGALVLVPVADLPADALTGASTLVYLGRTLMPTASEPAGTPVLAAVVDEEAISEAGADRLGRPDASWATLRTIGATLSDRDAGLLTQAVAMANWHETHQFSPRSGEPLAVVQGGWVRTDSGGHIFPRTDPAVIVAVLDDDDRLLLGSNSAWESNRYSLLAGFVEPGESLEAAVIREVHEETGLRVSEPTYLGSQPWPFPASLMIGFTARAADLTTLAPDGEEIIDLRWFSRDDLRAALGEITLPGPASLARAIIDHWYGAPVPDGQS